MSLVSGIFQADAAEDAAEEQGKASEEATRAQLEMYYQSREDIAPWRVAGEQAINALMGTPTYDEEGNITGYSGEGLLTAGPGEFEESPGYRFSRQEGLNAIGRAMSATGRLGSGAHLRSALRYSEGLASQEYDKFLDRYYQSLNPYLTMAGYGQVAGQQSAQNAVTTGSNIASNALYAGNAAAAGQINQANAIGQAGQNALNAIALGKYMGWWGGGSAAGANELLGGYATLVA